MIAITVDDERPMLKALTAAVSASPDIVSVTEFNTCAAAFEWAAANRIDLAFLDIHMGGMGGLVLAEKLLKIHPDCKIIFCTGHAEYAVEAFKLHASGYLIKPVTEEAVQREIDHVKGLRTRDKLLFVKCFGNFEVYKGDKPLAFKRSKTKELLAFLVDREGAGVTTKQICAALWEDGTNDIKNRNYLYQLLEDLRCALEKAEVGGVLVKRNNTYAVDRERLECDYYNYLRSGKPEFMGEYMAQYSWAEETCGLLVNRRVGE